MVPVLSRSREFSLFLDGTGTGTGKKWSQKKVPVPVPEKNGPGKNYRSRYRKKLVPEKSTGPGTGKNWSRKKVPVPAPEKILGTVTLCHRPDPRGPEIPGSGKNGCFSGWRETCIFVQLKSGA